MTVDKINQVGSLTLAALESRLRQYRDDPHRPFGGIPMVMYFGDFFQFDPVLQTSLPLPERRDRSGQRSESWAKHVAAHKLFLQSKAIVILREQWVRAHGKHISIFVAELDAESGKRLRVEELRSVLRHGDDSQLPTPELFIYAQGMAVVAVDIFPDSASGTVTLHLGPPVAVLLESNGSAGPAIPGLPNDTIPVKSKTVAMSNHSMPRFSQDGIAAGTRAGWNVFKRTRNREAGSRNGGSQELRKHQVGEAWLPDAMH
ncbi:hypothetical protein VTK26DRAFT_374 [Humicola hyalothermophila]